MILQRVLVTSVLLAVAVAHSYHDVADEQTIFTGNIGDNEPWNVKYGAQDDLQFTGPLAFSHLPYHLCLSDVTHSKLFDIAILGFPFDTTTTYRPGARFGPFAIRSGSRRQTANGYTLNWSGLGGPRELGANIVDCGDVSATTLFAIQRYSPSATRFLSPHSTIPKL